MSADLAAAAAEIDRRHQEQHAGEQRVTQLVFDALKSHPGLTVCDRLSDDCIGLVLDDGSRFYLTAEAT